MNEDDIQKLQSIWGVRSGFSGLLVRLKGYFQRLI